MAEYTTDCGACCGEWRCLLCGVRLNGLRQQSAHLQNYNLRSDDPRRCDNVTTVAVAPLVAVTEPEFTSNTHEIIDVATTCLLTRRDPSQKYVERRIPRLAVVSDGGLELDFVAIQLRWNRSGIDL